LMSSTSIVNYVEMIINKTICNWETLSNDSRNQCWSVVARGDIGGFDIGSDLAWQAIGLIELQPFKYVSFLAGYCRIATG